MTGFIAVCLFAAGCFVGALMHKLISSSSGTTSRLSKNLDNVSQDFAEYQDKVDAHFKETADLVHSLTQNYAAVHQKLATGALELSRASFTSLATEAARSEEKAPIPEQLSAPIDYPERSDAKQDNDDKPPSP